MLAKTTVKQTLNILLILFFLLLAVNTNAQGFKIGAGSCVVSGNNTFVVINEGAINNNGSFNAALGTVSLKGTTAQNIGGSSTTAYYNLLSTSSSTITVNGPVHIVNSLLVSSGSFNANDKLTLVSSATQTAFLNGSGSGAVTGDVTMQRYLASGFGYKYISSPFTAATVNSLKNYVPLTDTFPVMYSFNESLLTAGWEAFTDTNNVLTPLKGYAVNFGNSAAAKTFDIKGVVNNGTVTLSPLYNHNNTYTQGFQLVGNPYPSPIDWDAVSGWTKNNIDNAIYYFNNGTHNRYTGTYSSYINGVSSDGIANNIVPAMQGFFVHVSNGSYPVSGSLQVTNAVRTTQSNPTYHRQNGNTNLLRLTATIENEKSNDPLVVYVDDGANNVVNYKLDAQKLMNTNANVPSVYVLAGDKKLSIKAIAAIDSNKLIPIGIKMEKQAWVSFKLTEASMSDLLYVYLIDKQAKTVNDIKSSGYGTTINVGVNNTRFALYISKKRITNYEQVINTDLTSVNTDVTGYRNNVTVKTVLVNGERSSFVMFDMSGKTVFTKDINQSGKTTFTVNVPNGIYVATVYINNKNLVSKKIFITN